MKVIETIKKLASKGIWHTLALLVVMLVAGPELMLGAELFAMIEVMGASTFVLVYLSGVMLFIDKLYDKFKEFESYSVFFIPTRDALKNMPSLVVHMLPERTVSLCFMGFLIVAMLIVYSRVI